MMMVIAITEKGEKKMPRYIDADILPKLFDEEYKKTRKLIEDGETHLDNLAEGFSEATRVVTFVALTNDVQDVKEVRHGRWIKESCYMHGPISAQCSVCELFSGTWLRNEPYKYCPHCGAKMDGERQEGNDNG